MIPNTNCYIEVAVIARKLFPLFICYVESDRFYSSSEECFQGDVSTESFKKSKWQMIIELQAIQNLTSTIIRACVKNILLHVSFSSGICSRYTSQDGN